MVGASLCSVNDTLHSRSRVAEKQSQHDKQQAGGGGSGGGGSGGGTAMQKLRKLVTRVRHGATENGP